MTHDDRFLTKIGVRSARHQRILIEALPCGIETAKEAWRDRTRSEVNLPRAILVTFWKGMVSALIRAEREESPAKENGIAGTPENTRPVTAQVGTTGGRASGRENARCPRCKRLRKSGPGMVYPGDPNRVWITCQHEFHKSPAKAGGEGK